MWWIGGSPCSGKSTVAAALAAAHGLPLYSCDDAFDRHARAGGPTLRKVTTLSAAERLAQPLDVQVADVLRACHEEFPLIRADVAALGRPALAEGAALLPELLATLPVPAGRAVWIVPTEAFQRRHYARRSWARDLVAGADDPEAAFERWMRRDARFARIVAAQARQRGFPVITVDGGRDAAAVTTAVARLLGLGRSQKVSR